MTTAETISGVVEARNERGIRVLGEWRNLSKFKPLELPDVGDQVALGMDGKGFITTIEVLDIPIGMPSPQLWTPATRLAVLEAAAEFGASRPDLKSADVLRIADSWLAWVQEQP